MSSLIINPVKIATTTKGFTVKNASSVELKNWDCTVRWRMEWTETGSHTITSLSAIGVGQELAHEWMTGQRQEDPAVTFSPCVGPHFPATKMWIGFSSNLVGVKFAADIVTEEINDKILAVVTPGCVIEIIDDTANRQLTRGELQKAQRLLHNAMESGLYKNVVKDGEIWDYVMKRVCKDTEKPRTTEQFAKAYFSNAPRTKKWPQLYIPPTPVTVSDLKSVLSTDASLRIDVYWRALDRYPGGNADMVTAKYQFFNNVISDEVKGGTTVKLQKHNNWDGSLAYGEQAALGPLTERFIATKAGLFASLQTLAEANTSNSEVWIVDTNTVDSDEYDTEWSSVEVLVYTVKPDKEPSLVFRLHQKAVMGPQYRGQNNAAANAADHKANTAQQAVLTYFTETVGMPRVEQQSEGEGRANEEQDNLVNYGGYQKYQYGLPYVHPLYLNF